MNLKTKFILALLSAFVVLSGIGALLVDGQLSSLNGKYIRRIANHQMREVLHNLETSSDSALAIAALFSQVPDVLSAYQIAHSGNIQDESDPSGHEARNLLRRMIGPNLEGYEKIMGGRKLKLHFHLPNGRSLVRLWRDKQIQRESGWVDVSDDISGFRSTVLDVNRTGQPVKGIEVGRGGFVIRGLAPIKDNLGAQLGSVEVLVDFETILRTDTGDDTKDMAVYMNADLLPIAHRLQDPAKFPVLEQRFVQVAGFHNPKYKESLDAGFLEKGREGLAVETTGDTCISVFPVQDYKGKQVGVLAHGFDAATENALIRSVEATITGLLAAILLTILLVVTLLFVRGVLKPIDKLVEIAGKMAEGRLDQRIPDHGNDEIGVLYRALDHMITAFKKMFMEIREGVRTLSEAVGQISSTASQLAVSASQTSSSIAQISTTMEEVRQTARLSDEHAARVSEDAGKAAQIAEQGAEAAGLTISGMERIKNEVGYVVESIIKLSEQTRGIGEIINAVNDLADQSNLLSVNAAIEASKAGEHGKGFTVVAQEIKSLASQSKDATNQVRKILNEIQNASSSAVMAAEKGNKAVDEGAALSARAGDTIEILAQNIARAAETISGIAHSSNEQLLGMDQLSEAMINIKDASMQNVDGARLLEEAAQNLKDLADRLDGLTGTYRVAAE